MNTITHEGNDYEVLSLDRISEITHAELAGGEVVESQSHESCGKPYIFIPLIAADSSEYQISLNIVNIQRLGIQPLKLLEKVPVEFTDTFAQCVDGKWYPVYSLDDGFGYQQCEQKVFRCVEVTK